ncbi:unnamed protein product [Medioppia subpectinata]|uniref:Uncharacterized protein n=1 Tax=Medioppia subpectinata TaxID=1979941 RepID=A0A7R9LBG1_9ACAR|nr:unnamed protein product [Medioppia subpectinata]CAG2117494.1 unnamed protein product [Medioppia subpectinata]
MMLSILFTIFDGIRDLLKNLLGIRRRCESKTRLDHKVVVITGGNTGIGKETALQLTLRGAKVIIGCRDLKKGENAVKDIKSLNAKADINVMQLDLSSLSSVRHFTKTLIQNESRIDILINNAGVMLCPEWTTEDGFEMQFGTNHLGHFLLTLSVMDLLKKSAKARVINVSSKAHFTGEINFENINLRNGAYSPIKGYNQSKLANILFTRELARRLGPKNTITAYSLHPGIIQTELGRHIPAILQPIIRYVFGYMMLSVELGAQTTLYCALEPSLDNESGLYYDDCHRIDNMFANATNDTDAQKLWELSCDLVKLDTHLRLD